jgi:hypothetical protein
MPRPGKKAKLRTDKRATSRSAASRVRTGDELIKAMQQARKLGLKLKAARVPALVRPPIDFSSDER